MSDSDGGRIVRLHVPVDLVDDAPFDFSGRAEADGTGDGVSLVQFLQRRHARDDVDLRRFDLSFGREIGSGRGDDRDFRNAWTFGSRFFAFRDAHDFSDDGADLFAFFERCLVVAEFVHVLISLEPQIFGPDKHKWIGSVHHGDFQRAKSRKLDLFPNLSRGQEFAGHRAAGADKVEENFGTTPGSAIDSKISLTDEFTVFDLKLGKDDFLGIGVVDAYLGDGLHWLYEPAQQRERPDSG